MGSGGFWWFWWFLVVLVGSGGSGGFWWFWYKVQEPHQNTPELHQNSP